MTVKNGRPTSATRVPRADSSASWASTAAVRRRMQRQQTRDTNPEMAIRRLLHARGLRYRVDTPPLSGLRRRADIVFGPARVAVFVDGCFWHGCPEHGSRVTHANSNYWSAKVRGNRDRDRDTDDRLEQAGWTSVRIWEHEAPEEAARRVTDTIESKRSRQSPSKSRPSLLTTVRRTPTGE